MNLGIVGCGTIAATYLQALNRLDGACQVTALYDVQPEKAKGLLPGAAICSSLEELVDRADVACVVISTPLHTHTGIADYCLRKKKHVLMEKPAALSLAEIDRLFALADEMGVVFHVAFHSSFGWDIDWYLNHLGASDPVFRAQNIRRLECGFFDPYMSEGVMLEDRKPLGGSYIDSGVNVLSVCSRLVPIEHLALRSHTAQKCADGVVYRSETVFADHCVQLVMRTGWDMGLNHKSTLLRFGGTDAAILLDHTGQAVWRVMPDGQKQLLYREDRAERLVNQYIRVFQVFAEALKSPSETAHRRQVLDVHKLLLCVGNDGMGSFVLP